PFGYIRKVKIENHFSLIHSARDDEIGVHRAFIPVDHEVWIEPIIKRALALAHCARFCFGPFADDWAPLQTKVFTVLNLVIAVVEHAIQAFVQMRNVVTAVEIVIDKNFPVAIESVMPSLEPVKVFQVQWMNLS